MQEWELKWYEAKKKLIDLVEKEKIPLDKIVVSFSGGKDSTVMLKMIEEIGWKNQVRVLFGNTRMEMDAMYKFVEEKKKEGWNIDTTEPELPMPIIYQRYGVPFHSKYTSEMIHRLQQHGFNFKEDTFKSYEELSAKYSNCDSALRWISGVNITLNAPHWVKVALVEKGDTTKIANKCCEFLKKKPFKKYNKEHGIKLSIIGVRAEESQNRRAQYKSCIWHKKDEWKYFPLIFFTEKEIWDIIKSKNIALSDAYTVYGCDRTGCFGCPFSKYHTRELDLLKQYEPNKAKACEKMYKDPYEMSSKKEEFSKMFKEFRKELKDND